MGGDAVRPPPEKFIEINQCKHSLDIVDTILKKFPEYGEFLAGVDLTLDGINQKSEAYEIICTSIAKDITNPLPWRVCAIFRYLHREFRDAFKCQQQAIKNAASKIDMLLELSIMQVRLCEVSGFIDTRWEILTLNPTFRVNWICLAVAYHYAKRPTKALDILEIYEMLLSDQHPLESERYERSEMLLYKSLLYEEAGYLIKAQKELHKAEDIIVNKVAFLEQLAFVSMKIYDFQEAEKAFRSLLFMNAENHKYFIGLQICHQLYSETCEYKSHEIERLDALYKSLQDEHKGSVAARRLALDFLEGEKFREAADNYIRPLLNKGSASLFPELEPLLNRNEKALILEQLFLTLEHSIRLTGGFPGSSKREPPWTLPWILHFLAELYSNKGQHHLAACIIDEAIEHTPTIIELYTSKAKIFGIAGDLPASASFANEARSMDLSCHLSNGYCTILMFQADQVEMGEKLGALFPNRKTVPHNSESIWHDVAAAESYFQQDDIESALKKYKAVEKHFSAICLENQISTTFHNLPNTTPQSYLSMLKFEDDMHENVLFMSGLTGIIRCYVKLYDSLTKSTEEEGAGKPSSTHSNKKKKKGKQKKSASYAKNERTSSGEGQSTRPEEVEVQSQAEELLMDAMPYMWLLHLHVPNALRTQILSFEVFLRRKKLLLAYKSLDLFSLRKDDPECHRCSMKFYNTLKGFKPTNRSEKIVKKALEKGGIEIRGVTTDYLLNANRNFLRTNRDSLAHRVTAAEMLYLVVPGRKMDAIKIIEESKNDIKMGDESFGFISRWKIIDCVKAHKLLLDVFKDEIAASRWFTRCTKYFPYSTYFKGHRSSAVKVPPEPAGDVAAAKDELQSSAEVSSNPEGDVASTQDEHQSSAAKVSSEAEGDVAATQHEQQSSAAEVSSKSEGDAAAAQGEQQSSAAEVSSKPEVDAAAAQGEHQSSAAEVSSKP